MLIKKTTSITFLLLLSFCFFCPLKAVLPPPNWLQLTPGTSPSARDTATLAFDPFSNTTILFGGARTGGVFLNDTWSYNGADNTWTQLNPPTSPPPRYGASMVFDPSSNTIILFGGQGNGGLLNDTWSYNGADNTWTQLNPATSPPARFYASMAFDPSSNTIILFGGDGSSGLLNDTWSYIGADNTWTQLNPATSPPARQEASMAFDPFSETIILFGGGSSGFLNDTWSYNGADNTWTQLNPATSPPTRKGAPMAFDPFSETIILFGGIRNTMLRNDTWSYNGVENTWTQLNPTTSPAARRNMPMIFDPPSGTMIIFGGYTSSAYTNQTWAFIVQAVPEIISQDSITFLVNTPSNFTILSTGYPIPSITLTGTLPEGIDFADNGDGTATLSGVPASNSVGNYALTLTAANGNSPDAQQNFTLIIGTLPQITSSDSTTFLANTPSSFTILSTGYPTPSITLAGTLPAGIDFDDNGDGTATLSGVPTSNSAGSYPLTLTAANGNSPDAQQNFTLIIETLPQITSSDSTTFLANTPSSFTVLSTGYPTPSITLTGTLPIGIDFVDNGDGTATLSGVPASNSAGRYPLTLTAANGNVPNAQQNFTLIIETLPQITSSDSTTFLANTPSSFTVLSTGYPTPSITLTGTLPIGIDFVDNGDGTATLSGIPASNTAGSYVLTLTAANGNSPDAQQNFTLNIVSNTTTNLVVTPIHSNRGQLVTLTVSVNLTSATGSITFFDGVKLLGVETLSNGQATLRTDALSVGKHFILVSYSGDPFYLGSTSSIAILQVK